MVYAQTDLLQKQVFLFERIDLAGKKPLKYLNAIYFIRPIEENIQILIRELHEPKYGNYFICMCCLNHQKKTNRNFLLYRF